MSHMTVSCMMEFHLFDGAHFLPGLHLVIWSLLREAFVPFSPAGADACGACRCNIT